MFRDEGEYDNAHTHIERAKLHPVNEAYMLGRAMQLEADVWYRQGRLEDSKREASHALKVFEESGTTSGTKACRDLLQKIEGAMKD